MFDYVRSEVPLPDGFKGELQTKDFACDMGTHVIRSDGRLILAVFDHSEDVPKAERPYPDALGLLAWAGSVRRFWKHEDANFHGIFNFYGSDYVYADDGKPYRGRGARWGNGEIRGDDGRLLKHQSHEYNAKFTDGKLVRIDMIYR